nr:Rab family GTPase [Candidatus Sigynarchaeota archaeon]
MLASQKLENSRPRRSNIVWRVDEDTEIVEESPPATPKEPSKPVEKPPARPAAISPDKVQFRWKIVVCGPGGVGKSTLLHRYFYRQFLPDMIMTIGVSHMSHIIERNGKVINLIIWDLSGQKRFEVLHPAYVGDATGAFVVFDISAPETLEEVNRWVELIRKFNPNNKALPIILVGTKVDLVSDQAYLDSIYKRIEEVMADLELQYICVTSSKTNYNVDETINFLIDYILWQQNLK